MGALKKWRNIAWASVAAAWQKADYLEKYWRRNSGLQRNYGGRRTKSRGVANDGRRAGGKTAAANGIASA
jgi:hypothetical protein